MVDLHIHILVKAQTEAKFLIPFLDLTYRELALWISIWTGDDSVDSLYQNGPVLFDEKNLGGRVSGQTLRPPGLKILLTPQKVVFR